MSSHFECAAASSVTVKIFEWCRSVICDKITKMINCVSLNLICYRCNMQKTVLETKEIKLVGLKTRSSYQLELDWTKGKIFPCVQKYFHEKIASLIPNRKQSGKTFCVYTDYESDYTGAYTYFIGEEVQLLEKHLQFSDELSTLIIPAQRYTKFSTEAGSMPNILRDAWESIWKMSDRELGGKRNYLADFEIYDERAADHNNLVLDIYIGLT